MPHTGPGGGGTGSGGTGSGDPGRWRRRVAAALARLVAPLLDTPPAVFVALPPWPDAWYAEWADARCGGTPLTPQELAAWAELVRELRAGPADRKPVLGDR